MQVEEIIVEETTADGTRRRITRNRKPSGVYSKTVEERRDGEWQIVGTEPVIELDVEGGLHRDAGSGGDANPGP